MPLLERVVASFFYFLLQIKKIFVNLQRYTLHTIVVMELRDNLQEDLWGRRTKPTT